MNELALFSGAGGGILGGKLLGWRTVCAVELDAYRCERLAQRQNEGFLSPFPIWCGDIAAFDGRPWRGIVDVVSGGFPCQDISAANPNAIGIAGPRSGLWKEMLRIICEVGPRYVLVENSPVLTSRGLGVVLGDLASLGYDAQWGVLGADDLGGFHKRQRIFIVGQSNRLRESQPKGCVKDKRRRPINPGESSAMGHADEARLAQRQSEPGDIGEECTPIERASLGALANGHVIERWPEHEQQVSARRGPRQQSSGGSDSVADCLWRHFELIECRDGKLRATKPGVCGMADGVANRVDRIGAIGDGQVPVVVAAAFQILKLPSK